MEAVRLNSSSLNFVGYGFYAMATDAQAGSVHSWNSANQCGAASERRRIRAQLKVKPAVGFTLPSAGVTPAPGEKYKSQNGEEAILLSGFWESAAPIL